jgi:hypothetical protein
MPLPCADRPFKCVGQAASGGHAVEQAPRHRINQDSRVTAGFRRAENPLSFTHPHPFVPYRTEPGGAVVDSGGFPVPMALSGVFVSLTASVAFCCHEAGTTPGGGLLCDRW